MRKRFAVGFFALILASVASAESCDDGTAAYVAGNFAKALTILSPLADQGDACAQLRLGYMYQSGQGVEKDVKKAIDFFKRAAAQGNKEAKAQAEMLESSAAH